MTFWVLEITEEFIEQRIIHRYPKRSALMAPGTPIVAVMGKPVHIDLLICCVFVGSLCLAIAVRAIWTGRVQSGFTTVFRSRHPARFWLITLFFFAFGALWVSLGLVGIGEKLAGLVP